MATPAQHLTELTLKLPKEISDRLAQRAAASGQATEEFVADLVEHFAEPPTPLLDLSGPIHQKFIDSGMTEDELGEELERAKHEMRAERRSRQAS